MTEQLNMRQTEVFRVVLQYGSMTKAAEVLGVSQPAVSRMMAAMTEAVGFALFRRDGPGLVPTEDAALLGQEIERAFLGLEHIRHRSDEIRTGGTGRVKLVAMAHYANEVLPAILADFLAANPRVRIDLDVQPRARIGGHVMAGRADLGFVSLPTHGARLQVAPLVARDAVALLPASSPLAAQPAVAAGDLEGVPFIAFAEGTPLRYEIDAILGARGVQPRIAMEVTTHEAICALVAAGAGVSVVGPFSDWIHRDPRLAVRPFLPSLPVEIGLLSPATGLSAVARRLHDHIVAHYRG